MIFILILFLTASAAAADTAPEVLPRRWKITTRWDYSVRQDGIYKGFANKELQENFVREEELSDGWSISGEARLLGALKRNGRPVAARLEGQEAMHFILTDSGEITEAGYGYPRLRGFPALPSGSISPGDSWEAPLSILLNGPDGQRLLTRQPASYSVRELKTYKGRKAFFIHVQWAMRHAPVMNGTHTASLILDAQTLAPVMARITLKEHRAWPNSPVEDRKGFALIFWDGIPPMDKASLQQEFENRFGGEDSEKIEFEQAANGLSVTLRNLHFQPDRAELLPESLPVLDELAAILKSIAKRSVLIRGHTASVGRPEDEQALSEERARTVADALTARGIMPRRLIYEGVGSSEPAASNQTEEGRRQNRRVELLILED